MPYDNTRGGGGLAANKHIFTLIWRYYEPFINLYMGMKAMGSWREGATYNSYYFPI